jgi:transcriptional regulator with XRE-family HTH domain
MGSEVDMTPTPSEEFAAWLAPAMQRAGYDIERLSGGRLGFAEAVGVNPGTVTRWLDGKSMPGSDKFEAIAKVLKVNTIDMLHGIGVLSAKTAATSHDTAVRSRPITPSEAADELGIDDPYDREMFINMVRGFAKRPKLTAAPDQGSSAAEG